MKTRKLKVLLFVVFTTLLNVSAQQLIQKSSTELNQVLQTTKNIVILDVRTPQEFAAGHLKGALNIDIYQDDFYTRIDKLNKKTPYLVYCRTSNRSGAAVSYMKQKGFATMYQMTDGFPGWAANKLAFEK